MALTPLHRERIRTSMLINRLQSLVEGKADMPPHAVTAALGLLRKTLPDQATTTVQGDGGGPIMIVTGVTRNVDADGNPDD